MSKKKKKKRETDFIPLALPEFLDKNNYKFKKEGFKPQDIEGTHKTEKIETKDGLNFNADVN